MTEEEKKAIEKIKADLQDDITTIVYGSPAIQDLRTVLNLIQKQQAELEKKDKEIEDWKNEYNHWCQLAIDRKKELEKKASE